MTLSPTATSQMADPKIIEALVNAIEYFAISSDTFSYNPATNAPKSKAFFCF